MIIAGQGLGSCSSFLLRSPYARKLLNCMILAVSFQFGDPTILLSIGGKVEKGGSTTADMGKERNLEFVSCVPRHLEGAGSSRWYYNRPEVRRIIIMCINI